MTLLQAQATFGWSGLPGWESCVCLLGLHPRQGIFSSQSEKPERQVFYLRLAHLFLTGHVMTWPLANPL